MTQVLLIDDDTELTNLLGEYLTEEGFAVEATADGRIGVAKALSRSTDLIVLDIMMPRMNGIEVLRKIRQVSDVPVLMLTARGDDVDRISGLNLGADDYVSKPCSPGELAARIRAILRRSGRSERDGSVEEIRTGDLVLYPSKRTAEWHGTPLELTGTEFSLLEVLARSAGQLVSKQEISLRAFGKPLTAFDRRIDVHISSIRQKLGTRADEQPWIQAVRGRGYQLLEG
ncbi:MULTISPECIES: response regulator [Agrobacterium]|uniref:Alkaline phosphatase synthesis transcriptional regulatory protein PhoP n=1 Tax=Agrobacterium rosae TaxID=1972867 RepID=A0A1R3TZV4_9HYPH|nr:MULTISPECIES: response regulator [Agrobacterium]KAA3509701.1 response regulator [Agrobacterium rosae]KAA3516624.1 response regulator [Agrobacterium rosae]MBN7808449.1 response regulator [Agrobacterium rosae]MCM2434900.1 response regulator [Agrobacterium rosae]MDX8315104.1 response regulator [Agrobacterium rosae]